MHSLIYWFLLGSAILSALGCRPGNESQKMAEVDGTAITQADLDRSAGKALSNAREQLYNLERQKLDEYIAATLLTREARNRNVSVATLLEQEVDSKVPPITEEEIQSFYANNKDKLRVELSKVHDPIRDYLREQKVKTWKIAYVKSLRSNAEIKTYLKPPPVYRAEVTYTGAPMRGSEKAPVTIVKFEDFQCPFCKTAQPTFTELLKKYDGKVRLVHKDLPLEAIHPQAFQAAEAARCAKEQGKFWEYHDKLYAESPKLNIDALKSYAKALGLNAASFDHCVVSGKYRGAVQTDLSDGARLGLTGTPTFLINGREISGARPLEVFSAIIDEELSQAK